MVLSMTGYGRAEQERSGRDITVEIKSVNSRYFEYTSRMPRSFAFLDDKLKKLVNGTISRGKTELALTVVNVDAPEAAGKRLKSLYDAAPEQALSLIHI